ncbi:MAG: hypothetical protein NVS9B10_23640 [Nevskia sp.]
MLSRRDLALCVSAAVFVLAGSIYWLNRPGSEVAIKPPPLSTAAQSRLARLDSDMGFQLARLQQSPTEPDRVAKVVDAWTRRGKFTADGADFDSAILLLGKAEKLIPTLDARIEAARAHIYSSRHRFVEARAISEKALHKFVDDELLTAYAADAALYTGDLAAGADGFRHLAQINPESSTPWVGLAYWAEITGDLEQAMDLLEKALNSTYPTPLAYERQAYIHSVMGEVRSKQGDLKEARRQFAWALTKKENFAAARNGLADVAQWEGKDDEAETLLRGLIDSESPNADYQVKLADLLDRHGKKDEAAQVRKEAETFYEWSVSTGFDGYLRPLAALKLAEGDYRRAAELAARDIEIRPTSESRAIYQNVLARAKAAGSPVNETALRKIVPRSIREIEKS